MARKQPALKKILQERGWTYRAAAKFLGVCPQWVSYVLNGQRESKSLSNRIKTIIPFSDIPPIPPTV